ncbi:MAG: DUF4276 family protein [Lentimicrobium sp.]|nr:DUF4276 family protein [Lentimicrobium sp.]
MNKQIIIGLSAEGRTDVRFLKSIIQRSFEMIAFECEGQIEVFPVQFIEKERGDFQEAIIKCGQQAVKRGVMVLCVHCDADAKEDSEIFKNKIGPSFSRICNTEGQSVCKILVPIIPVAMTEAWMLSDTELLKSEIGTDKSNAELGIDKFPEYYSDPKECIENAIRISRQNLTRRRRKELTISELYLSVGQQVSLKMLDKLPSYCKFKDSIRHAFRELNYLR